MNTNREYIQSLQEKIALYEDMQAYQELIRLFMEPLRNFVYSIVKSQEIAEELVSDVFIKIWQIRGQLTDVENLSAYLYVSAKNFSLNYITKTQKRVTVSLEQLNLDIAIHLNTPEEWLITTELQKRIETAISELPTQCKLIFKLVKENGLRYKDVASILNISPNTVRNQLTIAISRIRQAIGYNAKMGVVKSPSTGS